MSNYESEGFWNRYGEGAGSIAMSTTVGQFIRALPEYVYVSGVRYIDYRITMFPLNNLFWTALHKRKEYEHEGEIRAFIWAMGNNTPSEYLIGDPKTNDRMGIPLDSDLKFINEVYFHPKMLPWLKETVKCICTKFDFSPAFMDSSLAELPPI